MALPPLAAAHYGAALLALLPPGAAWPRDPASVLARVAAGLAVSPARLEARAVALLADAFPVAPLELLPEWEASLGLPDPCSGPAPSTEKRQAAVAARFAARGGQSVAYFVAVAAAMGFTITITHYKAARAGDATVGEPIQDEAWAHTWRVNAPATTVSYASAGAASAGDPLAAWGNTELECALRRLAPAHTVPIFAYS